jgi:hypothetical protein
MPAQTAFKQPGRAKGEKSGSPLSDHRLADGAQRGKL